MEDCKQYSRQDLLTMICEFMDVQKERAQQLIKEMADRSLIERPANKKGIWIKMVANLFGEEKIEEAPF